MIPFGLEPSDLKRTRRLAAPSAATAPEATAVLACESGGAASAAAAARVGEAAATAEVAAREAAPAAATAEAPAEGGSGLECDAAARAAVAPAEPPGSRGGEPVGAIALTAAAAVFCRHID